MQTQWQKFLLEQNAKLDTNGQFFFTNDAKTEIETCSEQSQLATLDQLGVIHVGGEDASAFLQSQLSNDINLASRSKAQFSSYNNPKGRILAFFLIVPSNDGYYLVLPQSIIEKTIKRLQMFVMRSKVILKDASDEYVCLGLINPQTEPPVLELPATDYEIVETRSGFVCKLPSEPARYLLLLLNDQAKTIWPSLTENSKPCSHHVWNWLDIQAGLPNINDKTIEEFVPQMVNLDLIDAVNFKKGCYPGQEIVARMHYLGKPKRRMFKLHSSVPHATTAGTDLFLAGGDGQSAGKLVVSEPAKNEGIDMLAVIRLSHQGSDQLRLGSIDGPVVHFSELPYAVESD